MAEEPPEGGRDLGRIRSQEPVARTARVVFPLVEHAHDEAAADLLTRRLQVHEKTAWMLRSLLG